MKGKISKIKNTKGELALPITTVEAVYLEDGKTKLSDEIKDVLKYEILDDEGITAEIPSVIEEIDGIKKDISEINSSLDNIKNNIPIILSDFNVTENGDTDNLQKAIDYAINNNISIICDKVIHTTKPLIVDFKGKSNIDLKLRLKPLDNIGEVIRIKNGINSNIDLWIGNGGIETDKGVVVESLNACNVKVRGQNFGGTVWNVISGTPTSKNAFLDVSISSEFCYRAINHGDNNATSAFGCYRSIVDRASSEPSLFFNCFDVTIVHYENYFNNPSKNSLVFNRVGSFHISTLALGGKANYLVDITNSNITIDKLFLINEDIAGENTKGVIVTKSSSYADSLTINNYRGSNLSSLLEYNTGCKILIDKLIPEGKITDLVKKDSISMNLDTKTPTSLYTEFNYNNTKLLNVINTYLDTKASKDELDIERARIDSFTKLSEGSTTADAEIIDARVGVDGFIYNNIGNAIREQIKDNVVLNNPYNVLSNEYNVGFVDLAGSFYNTDTNYMYTDYIKVYGNKIYWKNFISHKLIRYISCFDKNKNPLLGTGVNANSSELQISGEYELPTGCYYVIVSMFSENKNETYKSVVGFEPITEYEKPNTRYINSKFIKNEDRAVEINRLNGKTVYSFGDSLLYGHYSGEGFLDGLVNECNMKHTKCAINGAEVIQNIINQIYNAPTDEPDFVVLDGMINDATKDITTRLGELTALDVFESPNNHDTFYGSLEHIFYTLRNKYPNAKIIYVIPHLMPTRPIARQKTLADAIIKTCKKWAIPIVNIQEEGQINTFLASYRNKYSYDNQGETGNGNGTHLTGLGYDEFYKPMIKAKMLEII